MSKANEHIIKKVLTVLLLATVMVTLSGCRSVQKATNKKYIEIKADLQTFDRIELVKGEIVVFKNRGDKSFYVKNQVTGKVFTITEEDVYNYLIWGDKITDIPN